PQCGSSTVQVGHAQRLSSKERTQQRRSHGHHGVERLPRRLGLLIDQALLGTLHCVLQRLQLRSPPLPERLDVRVALLPAGVREPRLELRERLARGRELVERVTSEELQGSGLI